MDGETRTNLRGLAAAVVVVALLMGVAFLLVS